MEKITAPLERSKEKPLRFLRYFIMANYKIKNERRDAVVGEDEIYNWRVDRDNAALCNYRVDPFGFVRKIIRNVDHFISFTQGRGNDGLASIAMDSMQVLCGAAFSLHCVLLMAASNFPRPLFEHFVRQLESFLFYYIFTKTPTKDLERNLSTCGRPPGDWGDPRREATGGSVGRVRRGKISEEHDFQRSRIGGRLETLPAGLNAAIPNTVPSGKADSVRRDGVQGNDCCRGLSEYTVLEIEHILPNTPENELRVSFTAANPAKSYDEYKTRLGNLTMLEKPINIVAGNGYFGRKKEEYVKSGNYLTRSIAGLSTVGKNSSITRINGKLLAFDD